MWRDPARSASIAAILDVVAEMVLMAAIPIVEDDGFIRDYAEAGDIDEALSLLRLPRQIDELFISEKANTLFVAGAHFLQKPCTRFQRQNSVEVLLAPAALNPRNWTAHPAKHKPPGETA